MGTEYVMENIIVQVYLFCATWACVGKKSPKIQIFLEKVNATSVK